jgi:hypothetical protein
MNANEFEQYLKFTMFNEVSYCKDIMRKQNAQIEELKKHLEFAGIIVEEKIQQSWTGSVGVWVQE